MFRVPKKILEERLSACAACKHFRKSTGSCGTLAIGNKLSKDDIKKLEKENLITRYKNKIRLCGCVMRIKARLHWSRCPIGTWGAYGIDEKRRDQLRKFIKQIRQNGHLETADVQKLYSIRGEITGVREQVSNCPPCVKSALRELEDYLND